MSYCLYWLYQFSIINDWNHIQWRVWFSSNPTAIQITLEGVAFYIPHITAL